MATLTIASKANQATFLPALLVATRANELDTNTALTIRFEEVDTLKAGGGATAELTLGSGIPTYGSENIIAKLVNAYPFLQGKHENLVSRQSWGHKSMFADVQ